MLANDRVDFDLYPGEVHGLVGENGAGKTTLMNLLAGFLRADAGELSLRGERQPSWDARRARAARIGMVHQQLQLVDGLTVLENLLLAARAGGFWLDVAGARRRFAALVAPFRFTLDFDRLAGELGGPERQWLALARLLVGEAELLILDEPTAFIGPRETERLLAFLRRQAGEGRAVAFISHKLPEVLAVADRITVLRRGRVVGRCLRGEADERDLAQLMVGEQPTVPERRAGPQVGRPLGRGAPLLSLGNVTLPNGRLREVSLGVWPGEVVGIGGVAGNGMQELAELLVGVGPAFSGEVVLGGRPCRGRVRPEARRGLLAHIPGEAARRGLVRSMRVEENCLLGHQRRPDVSWHGWIRAGARRALAQTVLQEAVVAVEPREPVTHLSGGMQQRLVVARALTEPHRLLLAEQPSAGLDVRASAAVGEALRREAEAGSGVLLITYDVDELLATSDRLGVLYDGRLFGPYPRAEVSRELLADLMAGLRQAQPDRPPGGGHPESKGGVGGGHASR